MTWLPAILLWNLQWAKGKTTRQPFRRPDRHFYYSACLWNDLFSIWHTSSRQPKGKTIDGQIRPMRQSTTPYHPYESVRLTNILFYTTPVVVVAAIGGGIAGGDSSETSCSLIIPSGSGMVCSVDFFRLRIA